MEQPTEKTRTYAYSLYPDDAAVIEALAAEQFRYNTSEAARFIIRFFRDAQPPCRERTEHPEAA